jgi:glyoxylase I family protein
VGLHHVAFEASSKEMVDERFRWAAAQHVAIENEPQEWSYVAGYDATFFHDPDGLKLEVVFVP